jgi:hypothetical protein
MRQFVALYVLILFDILQITSITLEFSSTFHFSKGLHPMQICCAGITEYPCFFLSKKTCYPAFIAALPCFLNKHLANRGICLHGCVK